MGRPRKYVGDADDRHREAVRAHRAKTEGQLVPVERAAIVELIEAVEAAARAGDVEAEQVRTGHPSSLLRNLALVFRRRVEGGKERGTGDG